MNNIKSFDKIGVSNDEINAKDFTELDHFQRFIANNNIKSNSDLKKRYLKVHSRLKYLKFNDDVVYTEKTRDFKTNKNLNNLEDFQKFVDENNIENYSDFNSRFPSTYKKLVGKHLAKEIKYKNPLKYERENKLRSIEEFQKFINDNNISSPNDFRENYKTEYKWALDFGYLKKGNRLLTFPGWLDTSKLNTIEDFKKFIEENNIKNVADMLNRFPKVDKRMRKLGIKSEDVGYTELKLQNSELDLYTFDYIQNYIIVNKIVYLDEIRRSNMSMYAKILRNKWDSKLEFPLRPKSNPELKKYNSETDFQELINKENIQSPSDFRKRFNDIYSRLTHLKLTSKVIYPNRIQKFLPDGLIDNINTVQEFQEFINTNNIKNPSEFQKRYYSLYRKSLTLPEQLVYVDEIISMLENSVREILDELKIKYHFQKTFTWLKYNKSLKLDFYLEDFNIAIEAHGDQHFIPVDYFGGLPAFNEGYKRDLTKYNLCNQHNIKILYYYDPNLSGAGKEEKVLINNSISNYFSPIITNKEGLIKEINTYKTK